MQARHQKRAAHQRTKPTSGPPRDAEDEHMQHTSRAALLKKKSVPALPPDAEDEDMQDMLSGAEENEAEDDPLANQPESDAASKCSFWAATMLTTSATHSGILNKDDMVRNI